MENKTFYIETYGCQMNVNDSEVVAAILKAADYRLTERINEADIIFINTCSIRENAEQRVWGRLDVFRLEKRRNPSLLVGVLGCMAERLKEDLLGKGVVDMVVGPDAYRQLPLLVAEAEVGQKGINVLLSREETYADISPVRLDKNGVSAFVSIMRGCNNMCAYCVVPYTRGAERSRPPETILREVRELFDKGYREVTLLGQNVNSYSWTEASATMNFAQLLEQVALVNPLLRLRFATSHPKDMSDELLHTMAKQPNICRHIHLPVQSGSSRILELMNRKYTREHYLERIAKIKAVLPDSAISTDIIAGFCTETLEDHNYTLSLMKEAGFDQAFMFQYSERPNTKTARHFKDDVPAEEKTRRLNEIIALQNKLSLQANQKEIGQQREVLVEGLSKRSSEQLFGRTSQNKVIVFPKKNYRSGDYVQVQIERCSSATLFGLPLD
ncbi:MAG: tRNA (N6-isopentenyl adenosine(37)-C2)-methylthiotransferase MiaB [Bacteroidales bacterium]|nr:tRNA (N6-isopentenyl adenosine(37)-C2)-methylthiotransferase MiaB [Bacteroidales bacterium]MCL2132900.1 tRNA (N6-isopentenyl adenosine(37)-C2)-methylthiotransferase MiaB [Bacteroidales bacterium]